MLPAARRAVLLTGKALYRALGIPDVRHRRAKDATTQILMRRLLSLDYLIERPTLGWLPTEAEKVQRFEALGIERRTFPYRLYGPHGKPQIPAVLRLQVADRGRRENGDVRFTSTPASPPIASCARGAWPTRPSGPPLRARTFAVHVVAVGTGVAAAERAAPVLKRWTQDGDGQGAGGPGRADQGRPGHPPGNRPA